MRYISQLAAITEATKSTQQYTPYFTMALGVERCVTPNTIEANVANSRTAVKWEGAYTYAFLPIRKLCASTAAMKFSNPATTTNFVP